MSLPVKGTVQPLAISACGFAVMSPGIVAGDFVPLVISFLFTAILSFAQESPRGAGLKLVCLSLWKWD